MRVNGPGSHNRGTMVGGMKIPFHPPHSGCAVIDVHILGFISMTSMVAHDQISRKSRLEGGRPLYFRTATAILFMGRLMTFCMGIHAYDLNDCQ